MLTLGHPPVENILGRLKQTYLQVALELVERLLDSLRRFGRMQGQHWGKTRLFTCAALPPIQKLQKSHAMPPILRNLLAVVAGFLVGSAVNMAIITVGPWVIPLPEGVDMSNIDKFAENLELLQPVHFIAPWLAHALGTLVGACVAAKVAATHKMKFAFGVSLLFLLGGIIMVSMVGGPGWFSFLDLIGAYLPMGYLGGLLGGAKKKIMILRKLQSILSSSLKQKGESSILGFPHKEWALGPGAHKITRDYPFIISCVSNAPHFLYIYSIKKFDNLLKIGITHDVEKRKEVYYDKLLHLVSGTKENLVFIEFCLKHATYHLANKAPPKWNVGNFQEENLRDSIKEFCNTYPAIKGGCSGHTEVREIELPILISLIDHIQFTYENSSKEELFDQFAIKEFNT